MKVVHPIVIRLVGTRTGTAFAVQEKVWNDGRFGQGINKLAEVLCVVVLVVLVVFVAILAIRRNFRLGGFAGRVQSMVDAFVPLLERHEFFVRDGTTRVRPERISPLLEYLHCNCRLFAVAEDRRRRRSSTRTLHF